MGLECALWQLTPAQLDELMASDEAVDALICGEENSIKAECLDLDKGWHALHFFMTGEPHGKDIPLSYAIMVGGIPIADDYVEGAIYLPPDEVKEVAIALSALSDDKLRRRYNFEAMTAARVYRFVEDDVEALLDSFHKLRDFYQDAAKRGNAVLRHIG